MRGTAHRWIAGIPDASGRSRDRITNYRNGVLGSGCDGERDRRVAPPGGGLRLARARAGTRAHGDATRTLAKRVRRPRQPRGVVFRSATERDGPSLSTFSCSRGASHEDEVEQFVRTSALRVALAPDTHYRLFVVFEQERLIAVAGHHPEALLVQDQSKEHTFRGTLATRLNLVALSIDVQGRRLDGRRLSDLVMESLNSRSPRQGRAFRADRNRCTRQPTQPRAFASVMA
jgi:hypothetical protein